MKRFAQFVVKRRKILLAVALAITAFLGVGIGSLTIIIDPDETLPQAHRFLVATNLVDRIFGNKFPVIIGVSTTGRQPLSPAVIEAVRGITDRLAVAEGVVRSSLVSLTAAKVKDIEASAEGISVRPLVSGETTGAALLERVERNGAFRNLLVSADGTTAVVIAEFRKDARGFKAIAERVEAIVAPYRSREVAIAIGGQPIFLALAERFSDRMLWLFPIALVIIGLVHWEGFRSAQGLALPLLTGLLAVVWAVGTIGWLGISLDAFNGTTPILVLAIAVGHAVQMLKRYYEEFARAAVLGLAPVAANQRAVIESLATVGPVLLAAGAVATMSFASLAVFDIATIRTFGIFTAMGIGFAVVIEILAMPALRASLPPPGPRQLARERGNAVWDRATTRLYVLVTDRPAAVLAVSTIIIGICLFGAAHVQIDNSLRSYFASTVRERIDDAQLNGALAGNNLLYVLVDGHADDAIKAPAVLAAIDRTQHFLDGEPSVGKTVSIVDFLKRIDAALSGQASGELPQSAEQAAQYLLLYAMSGGPGDFDSLIDYGYRRAVITAYLKEESSTYLIDLERRLREVAREAFPADVEIKIGGTVMTPVALNEVLVGNKLLNIGQVALAVFVISTLFFRSLVAGALVLVPLGMTVAANFGVMGFLGIPLNVATATVSAMAVGIGADYAIYLLSRLKSELADGATWDQALRRTFATAGKAVLFVAIGVAAGYAVLMSSLGFLVHVWLGLLISIAMVTSACAALTTLPALIWTLRPRFLTVQPLIWRTGPTTALGLVLAILGATAAAAEPSAVEIMDRNYKVQKVQDSSADVIFRLVNGSGEERVRKTAMITRLKDGSLDTMRLIRFREPADVRGTATLTIENAEGEDDIWIYLPALRKVRRLVSSNKRDAYVGTDFSYGDVIGYKTGQWQHSIIGTETVDGALCYRIESVPLASEHAEQTGYSKRVSWIRTDNYVQVKGEYFDTAGHLFKELRASEIRQVDSVNERWQPMYIEMRNLDTVHRTGFRFQNFVANQGVSADLFKPHVLERDR